MLDLENSVLTRIPVAGELVYLLGCYKSMSTTCLHSHISIYSKLILFNDSKYVSHSIDSLSELQSKDW